MNKSILYILILVLLSSFASAYSTDRTKYLSTGGNNYAYDDTDNWVINGSTGDEVTAGDNPADYGWTEVQGTTLAVYDKGGIGSNLGSNGINYRQLEAERQAKERAKREKDLYDARDIRFSQQLR